MRILLFIVTLTCLSSCVWASASVTEIEWWHVFDVESAKGIPEDEECIWVREGTDEIVEALAGHKVTRKLFLGSSSITTASVPILTSFPHLTHLDISLTRSLSKEDIRKLMSSLGNLETLDLAFTHADDTAFERAACLKMLEFVNCAGTRVSGEFLRHLHAHKAPLRYLRMASCQWLSEKWFESLALLGELREVSAGNCGAMSVAAWHAVIALPKLARLSITAPADMARPEFDALNGRSALRALELDLSKVRSLDDAPKVTLPNLEELKLILASTAHSGALLGEETVRNLTSFRQVGGLVAPIPNFWKQAGELKLINLNNVENVTIEELYQLMLIVPTCTHLFLKSCKKVDKQAAAALDARRRSVIPEAKPLYVQYLP